MSTTYIPLALPQLLVFNQEARVEIRRTLAELELWPRS